MDNQKTGIKHFLFFLLVSILILPNATLSLAKKTKDDFIKTLIGEDPKKDADPASVDILKVYIANNGTHFEFIIKCQGKPSPSAMRAYVAWVDTKGDPKLDYCLVADGISGLFEVKIKDGIIILKYKAPIVVKVKGKSIYLMTSLENIDYPDGVKDVVGVVVTTHQIPFKEDSSEVKNAPKIPGFLVKDRAPDSGRYQVDHEVIPELPGFTPFIFIPSVVLSVYVIYRRKFKKEK